MSFVYFEDLIKLPKDATPIDFSYAVHTKIYFINIIGFVINGKGSPLQSTLVNGDVVKIITSKKASPSLHWKAQQKQEKQGHQ